MSQSELKTLISKIKRQMERAAANLDFELAAQLRDQMLELRGHLEE